MTRPRRLYTTDDGKFYYLIDGKKKFVKAPAGISQKQIAKINIKNIVNAPAKRLKRRRKRIEPAYGKKVGGVLQKSDTGGLPIYFFKPKKEIPTLEEQAKASDDTTTKQLTNLIQETKNTQKLLQGISAVPSSSKIPPTIASERPRQQIEESKGEPEIPESNLPKPRGKPAGTESTIRPSSLLKAVRNYAKTNKKVPTLDEINKGGIIKSKYGDVPPELYNKVISEYNAERPSLSRQASEAFKNVFSSKAKVAPAEEESEFESLLPEEPRQGAKGTGDGDGLYNDEIEKIVKKRIKNYVPVIASDEINELPRYVARGDKRFGFVINTNPSTSDGSGNDGYRTGHWRSVYINNEDDYPTVEYFDPLTEGKMPPELITMCRKIAMKMNPSMMFKYKQNMLRRQSKMTSNCGWHSVKFLDDRYNGVPWSEATGYDSYMAQHSSAPDDSHDGERDIAKTIKKYESYI